IRIDRAESVKSVTNSSISAVGTENRVSTSRYSRRIGSETSAVTSWSRQSINARREIPGHRLEITTLVSKTALGLGTCARTHVSDQAGDIALPSAGSLSRFFKAS